MNRKYRDTSTTDEFPKTLLVRNTPGGMIWQVYHVNNASEAQLLSINAQSNAFMDRELTDYDEGYDETWSDWRTTGAHLVEKASLLENELNQAGQETNDHLEQT